MATSLSVPRRRFAILAAWLILPACVGLVLVSVLSYLSLREEAVDAQRQVYLADTRHAADVFHSGMGRVERAAETLAGAVGDGSLAPARYEAALREMVVSDPLFYGGAIAFAPYAFDPGRRLYGPYFSKKAAGLEFMYIEDGYDYTRDEYEWFGAAMRSGSRWSEPYFDESVGDILMTTYSAVIRRPGRDGQPVPVGVVTIDIAVDAVGKAVEALGVGGSGYPEVVTGQGRYLYSPDQSRVLEQVSLFEEGRWQEDEGFRQLRKLLEQGSGGMVEVRDAATGREDWVSVAPVDETGWRIVGNYAAVEVDPRSAALRHRLMWIILGLVLASGTLLLRWQVAPPPAGAVLSWPTSALVSAVLVIGAIAVWTVALGYASGHDRVLYSITSSQALAREIEDLDQRAREHLTEQPVYIPTGLYVESMKFLSATDIQMVGSVWQKFDAAGSGSLERGIILPGAATVRMGDTYTSGISGTADSDGGELVRRQFQADLRIDLDYSRFPLVKDLVGIGIFPRDTQANVALVPDLASYPYLAPSSLPGLGPDVFLPGWRLERSYFELRPWRHHTTFGEQATVTRENLPELYFTVEIQKAFFHAIVSYLTPLTIAALISFFTLAVSTRDKNKLDILRTGVGFELGISASVFFVVVLSHIGLRERIVSEQVFYLEYFYLLQYGNLLWVCCRSILSGLESPVLDRLAFGVTARKAFFPVNLLCIFGFTWCSFYY